jgi:Cys-tRNA(Pro)/Cys-tRNA(Cys) deacylase
METRATTFLTRKKIPFKLISYVHKEKGAKFAAQAIGFPLEKTIKTLVADLGNDGYVLALLPGDKHLMGKKLARACCAKKAVMTDTDTAERLTGYRVGGISPFGTKKKMPVVLEAGLMDFDNVAINGGQRGLMLIMNPKDIIKATKGAVADLAG